MARIADTTLLVGLERRGLKPADLLLLGEPEEAWSLTAISVGEMLYGVHQSPTAAYRSQHEAFLEAFLEAIPVLPFDLRSARVYGRLLCEHRRDLEARRIDVHDLQIAATALAYGCEIVTDNLSHFRLVQGLKVVAPRWP